MYNEPMDAPSLGKEYAAKMDEADELAPYRSQFVIADPDQIYLDGNSLGRLPFQASQQVQRAVEREWGGGLVNSWGEGWWQAPARVGEKIAGLVGAGPGQVIVCDTVSVNLFKLVLASLELRPDRNKIVTDTFNFPSDLYVLQGAARLLGGRHALLRAGSLDGDITPDLESMQRLIDEQTALVTLSHVTFKSGYLYDMAELSDFAHRKGALVLWDLSHSVGAVPMLLDDWGADFAVGCTYKYLNGGPGSPAFLYVRKGLQDQAVSPIWGWWGQKTPFDFDLDYSPAPGISRFLTGTQPMLSLLAMESAVEILMGASMERMRSKSLRRTEYLISLFDARLASLGFSLGSPRNPEQRGAHVSLRHPEGYRINRALIEEMNLIPDFRAPDNLRLGLPPLYTTFSEIWEAVERIRRVVEEKRYEKYSLEKRAVT